MYYGYTNGEEKNILTAEYTRTMVHSVTLKSLRTCYKQGSGVFPGSAADRKQQGDIETTTSVALQITSGLDYPTFR